MSIKVRDNTGVLYNVAGMANVDAILSPTSKNAIQNKTVYAALHQKIDKTVNDLVNYYSVEESYNKKEVRDLIGAINTLTMEVVTSLPTTDISPTTIYLLQTGQNAYDEYIYINNAWVNIGSTEVDLTEYVKNDDLTLALQSYYTKTQTNALFNDYYDKDDVDDLLDLKQNKLEFDDEPTTGSANPVTSTGIKTAINNAVVSSAGGSIIKVHHLAGSAAKGDIVTASKGSYSVSATFDNSGNAIIIGFGEIGMVTITATNGSESGSVVINIPCFSNYSTTVMYGLDYKSWLIAGGMNPTYYDSLDQVLADEEAVRRLMTIHDSVDYLATLLNSTDEMIETIINNDFCAKWISLRDYAMDTLSANTIIKTYMDAADKYGYGEWALMPQVPIMTSNTTPYGVASASSANSGYEAYKAFDGVMGTSDGNRWSSVASDTNKWLQYQFISSTKIAQIVIYPRHAMTYNFVVKGSNDGSTFDDLTTVEIIGDGAVDYNKKFTIDIPENKQATYSYYRLSFNMPSGTSAIVGELQFYAWGPKGNIPVMTSNTSPYGIASASSENTTSSVSTTQAAWKAFTGTLNADPYDSWLMTSTYSTGWLQYQFTNPVCAKKLWFSNRNYSGNDLGRVKTYQIQASNDGINFTNLTNVITRDNSANAPLADETVDLSSNTEYYLYYRLAISASFASTYGGCGALQIYGREMKAQVPTMSSNTSPYGQAIGSSIHSDSYNCYKVFDSNYSTSGDAWHSAWFASTATCNERIGYCSKKEINIQYVRAIANTWSGGSEYPTNNTTVRLSYSYDGSNWTDIEQDITLTIGTYVNVIVPNDIYAKYWTLHFLNFNRGWTSQSKKGCYLHELQFFTENYSEYDWDTETPRHYLYDHGLELNEQIDSYIYKSGDLAERETNQLHMKNQATSQTLAAFITHDTIDLSGYNNAFINIGNKAYQGYTDATQDFIRLGVISAKPTTYIIVDTAAVMITYAKANASLIQALDLSSINDSLYLRIGDGTYTSTFTMESSVTEWWLE